MYVRPFTNAIQLAAWGGMRPSEARRRRSKTKASPSSAPCARTRSRSRTVSSAMGRAERHVGGVGAREAASRKPDENPHEKQERGALRVRVARACDEEDFQDRVTGGGMGCEREDNLVSGSPGRCGFGKWGRLFGDVSVRRHVVSVWVNEDVPGVAAWQRSRQVEGGGRCEGGDAWNGRGQRVRRRHPNSHRGAHETHKEGGGSVGVRRREGLWVSRWESCPGGRAKRRVGRAVERRAGGAANTAFVAGERKSRNLKLPHVRATSAGCDTPLISATTVKFDDQVGHDVQ